MTSPLGCAWRQLLCLVCVFFLSLAPLSASGEGRPFFQDYNFSFLNEDSGLPNNFVADIIKDYNGYVWFATHGGVVRYDGYSFVNFTTETSGAELKSNFATKLCMDRWGRLWIGSESGLSIIDLHSFRTAEIQRSLDVAPRPGKAQCVYNLYCDSSGRMWISSDDVLGCLSFSKDGKVSAWHAIEEKGLPHVYAFLDWGGGVCAGIGNNVYVLETEGEHGISRRLLAETIKPFSEDWRIQCMAAESDSLLWMGTNRGLFRYNKATGTTDRYRYSNHRPGMLSQAYITDIGLTSDGRVIVATMNGLNVYHPESDTFEFVRHDNDRPLQTLSCNSICCLLTDGEDIWTGTDTGGVNLLTPKSLLTEVLPLPVNAICEDRQGSLWLGIVEGGLNQYDSNAGLLRTFKFDHRNPHSISNNMLTGAMVDSDNHLWAYTWGVGINELDLNIPTGASFIRHIREDSLGLESDFLSSACEDIEGGGIWFATTRGLHFYRKADCRFVRILFPDTDNQFESVGIMAIDKKRRLWMPTSEGVFILDLNTFDDTSRNFSHLYLRRLSRSKSEKSYERVNCVLAATDGSVWLGSDGDGLYRLISDDGGEYAFVNFSVSDGLPDNSVLCMAEDAAGDIWMTTGYGISQLDTRKTEFTNYSQEDGLPSNQFYRNAIFCSPSSGKLYAGTVNGMVTFTPEVNSDACKGGKAVVSSMSVSGNKVYQSGCDSPVICIHEGDKNIVIELSTLNYGRLNRVKYAWRMTNVDDAEWQETRPGNHVLEFDSFPSGKYVLQIRSTDDKGHWFNELTEVSVEVKPHFYKTTPFILCMLLCLVTPAYVVVRRKRSTAPHVDETPSPASPASPASAPEVKVASKDEEMLTTVYEVMSRHYADSEYGVDEFVKDMGYSKTYINSKLQSLTGNSIGQFMRSYRLNAARETLMRASRDIAVADIALAVGFSDPKYFSRCFKEMYGISPSELLKKGREA